MNSGSILPTLGLDALLVPPSAPTPALGAVPTRQDVQAHSRDLATRAEWLVTLAASATTTSDLLLRLGVGGPLRASAWDLLEHADAALKQSQALATAAYEMPLGAPPLPSEGRRAGCCVTELRDEIRHRLQLERYSRRMLRDDLAALGCRYSISRLGEVERDEGPVPAPMLQALKILLALVRAAGARPTDPRAAELLKIGRGLYRALHSSHQQDGQT